MSKTTIEWTDESLNISRGCEAVSPGCLNCYAARLATRFSAPGMPFEGLAHMKPQPNDRQGRKRPSLAVWSGRVTLVPEALRTALGWSPKKPKRVFVGSVTDIFHKDVPFEYLAALFGVMAATPQVTYQLVTKRPERMREFFEWLSHVDDQVGIATRAALALLRKDPELPARLQRRLAAGMLQPWPLPNVHLMVSAENQETLDERVPILLDCPAVVHGISAEPLLGPMDIRPYLRAKVHGTSESRSHGTNVLRWVIGGGESGPGARPCELKWLRDLAYQIGAANREHALQGEAARTAFFLKQLGSCAEDAENGLAGAAVKVDPDFSGMVRHRLKDSHGGDESEWPADLQGLRAFPVPA